MKMRSIVSRVRVAVVGMAVVLFLTGSAGPRGGNSSSIVEVPTLDGLGVATLVGGLAMAGSWVVARRRRK